MPEPQRVAITHRWHRYRRAMGLSVATVGIAAGILAMWPAMGLVGVLGAVLALDASAALRMQRSRSTRTIILDILFTGVAIVVVGAPGVAVGAVVAYFLLVVAVLGESQHAWTLSFLAVAVGFTATLVTDVAGITDQSAEHSIVAGIVIVAVFGVATVGIAREFMTATRRGDRTSDRQLEMATAVSAASRSLVASDDVGALADALDAIREAMHTTVIFVERNVEHETLGLCSVVVERSIDGRYDHPSFDRSAMTAWSSLPEARSHLEGGAPFFYRVEEGRGTSNDRGGESGIRIEVDFPIVVNNTWVGVIGAADNDPERAWQTDDLVLLRTMAELTAALWERTEGLRVRESLIGSLDGRLRYEEALAKSSRALLGEKTDDLSEVLAAIGLAAVVDEVYIAETLSADEGEPAAHVTDAWAGSDMARLHHVGDVISYERMPGVRASMQAAEVAHWDDDPLQRLIVAINIDGAWFGSVTFVRHESLVGWSKRDVAFCQAIADTLSAYFERLQHRVRLEESLSSKDQLIASVSHELRSPLTAVVGLVDELIAAGDEFDHEERQQLMEIVSESSKEMSSLIEDLLVAARSEEGTLPVFPVRVDLSLLAQSVLSQLSVPDDWQINIDDTDSVAYADPVRVRQVIRNLLSNAVRYGVSPVTVSFERTETMAYVDVHDCGRGIPDDDRERIFQPYGRASSSRTVKASVGLGLALSRRLSQLMGGSLTYVEGTGSTFRLALPLPTERDR